MRSKKRSPSARFQPGTEGHVLTVDAARGNRPVAVAIAVRRDKEMQAKGKMQEIKGEAQQMKGDAKDAVKKVVDRT